MYVGQAVDLLFDVSPFRAITYYNFIGHREHQFVTVECRLSAYPVDTFVTAGSYQ